ncbi:MAG: MFS transporter, partial [Caulobacteraceae bacterium]
MSRSPALTRLLVLLCVSAPSFMLQLDANIVAVSLPSISHSLRAGFTDIEWVITAYTLSFASLVLPAGALADRFGRKPVLLIGLAVFTLASFLCGIAPNLAVLVGARALQGVGAALQLSAGLATLSHTFRGEARGRAFAFWGSVIGAGISLGPIIGGFITQAFGWAWAFYINLPIGAAMILLSLYVIEDSRDPDARQVDVAGVISFSGFLFLTTLGLISGNHRGWSDRAVIAELLGALAFLALFVAAETMQRRPMLDFSFFRKPTYLGANIAGLAYAAGLLTMLTFVPIFLQSGLGYPPRTAGLMMLPMALPLFIVPRIVATQLAHRLTGRMLLTAGLAIVSLGLVLMGLAAGRLAYLPLLAGMLATGVGAGILNGEIAKVSMTVIPPERAGMASGMAGTVRFSGLVIGFAALGAVLFARISAGVSAGLADAGATERLGFIRRVAAGDLSGAGALTAPRALLHALALRSFSQGYEALLFSAAALTGVSAVLTWRLVRAADTLPIPRRAAAD